MRDHSTAYGTGSAPRRKRRLATLVAAAALALGAALLVPVSTVGAVGLPNGITGSWGTGANATTRTGTGASVTENVGSLTAGTTYQFQVRACNASGTGGATACGAWSAALEKATSSG